MEKVGTNAPSMMSTWITRAPAVSTASICSPSRAKSAASTDGATPDSGALISAGAWSRDTRCTGTARWRTSARWWSAPRSSGTPTSARSGAGSSRSGSGRAGWSGAATARRRTGRRPRGRRRRPSCPVLAQPGDEEAVRPVAAREGLEEARHTRMVPDRAAGSRLLRREVVGGELRVGGEEAGHEPLVLGRRDGARRVDERAARAQRGRAGVQDRGLDARELGGLAGLLAPAGVRAAGERAEVGARRVDEHAVER